MLICSLSELAILSQLAAWGLFRLVDRLRVRAALLLRYVVAFVDEDTSVLFNAIVIWRAGPAAHQNDARSTATAKVHTLLQARILLLAHDAVGDHFARHEHMQDRRRPRRSRA